MKIYNTQTRQKEEFEPLEPGKVKIYVCGPTVYNYFHLGNARPFITYDTLRRYLEFLGYQVCYVQNFTDIDDKMIARANNENTTVPELAEHYIKAYFEDADQLNICRADYHPRATESIPMILSMIEKLVEQDFAYLTSEGIYFDISKREDYGKLSHQNLEDLMVGASERLNGEDDKRNSGDFALWKFKKPGEPAWPSPWGEGRPGWHIECSAMVKQYLGNTIDIHGGGQDLVFPHHENEIAQSESANHQPFVRYWMHNGFINIDHEKMSKSHNNFFTVRDLAEHFDHQVLRFFMLSGHYRMPINFSTELLHAAENGWKRIGICLDNLDFVAANAPADEAAESATKAADQLNQAIERAKADFTEAMDDDLNTADALAAIFELVRAANTAVTVPGLSRPVIEAAAGCLRELLDVLGLYPQKEGSVPDEVMQLLEQRVLAKKEKDFARADKIRDQIQEMGFQIEDTPQGPKVSRK